MQDGPIFPVYSPDEFNPANGGAIDIACWIVAALVWDGLLGMTHSHSEVNCPIFLYTRTFGKAHCPLGLTLYTPACSVSNMVFSGMTGGVVTATLPSAPTLTA